MVNLNILTVLLLSSLSIGNFSLGAPSTTHANQFFEFSNTLFIPLQRFESLVVLAPFACGCSIQIGAFCEASNLKLLNSCKKLYPKQGILLIALIKLWGFYFVLLWGC